MDSNSPFKDLLFLRGPNLAQNPLYLVGTVLKAFKRKQFLGAPDLILRLLSAQGTLAILAGKKVLPHSHHSII